MVMEIANSMTAMKQAEIAQEVQVRVAKKAMDAQRAEGEAALQLLNASMPQMPGLGEQIDVRA